MPMANTVEDLNLLRVDQVGSLVVPADLVAASERRLRGETSEGELREIEDKAIRAVLR
jgi:methionine synthase II (cobalamin-independent)